MIKSHRLLLILFLFIICPLTKVSAFFLSDTLYICQGESIQLETSPNQNSYSWSPDENISNLSVYNPIVSPNQTSTYTVIVEPNTNNNLVFNDDFSLGNAGFQSDYTYTDVSTFAQAHYGIFTSPKQFNAGFADCQDHSNSADGLMLVVDGATTINENVWCQNIEIEAGRFYDFSAWFTNIFQPDPSVLSFTINEVQIGGLVEVEENLCQWQEFSVSWFSNSNTTATICLSNQNTIAFGNDFAVDDISFTHSNEVFIDTFTVIVLESYLQQIDTSICANELVSFENVELSADSSYLFEYTAANGCDSIININVFAIDTFYQETRVDTLCLGDTLTYMGFPITSDTSICEVFQNSLGCDSSICFVVYFLSENTINVDIERPTCKNAEDGIISLTPFAGIPPFSYLWDTGESMPIHNHLAANTYQVTITDSKGCIAVKSILLEEPDSLDIQFNAIEPSCFGELDGEINILPSGGTPPYLITFENELPSENTLFEFVGAGDYNILLEDHNACIFETIFSLSQPDPIEISLPADTTISLGCTLEIDLEVAATFPYQIQWIPGIDIDCSNCESVLFDPKDSRSYEVSILDDSLCIQKDTLKINVTKNYEIFVPNAFSPNGDGLNDFLEIYSGKDVKEIISFSVFNRWGAIVFQRENFISGDSDTQWDGYFKNNALTSQVFVYIATVEFVDGVEKIFSGDVSIVK